MRLRTNRPGLATWAYLISLRDFDLARGSFAADFWFWSTCPSADLKPLEVMDFVNAIQVQTRLPSTSERSGKKPGRAAPLPALPNTNTLVGRAFSKLSMMTCAEQLSTGIFSGIKKIWPRRVLIIDEQKGLAAAFPPFIHDGTRRPGELKNLPDMPPQRGLAMMVNMVTMETFKIRSGKIHEVEVFPFITFNYGLGDGWTPAAGR